MARFRHLSLISRALAKLFIFAAGYERMAVGVLNETERIESTLPVMLDTDIGTDVDDLLALALIVGEPGTDLLGVTTTYGDVDLRARIAKRALRLLGRDDVPVHAGMARPRSGREVWPGGHEGDGMADLDSEEIQPGNGVDALIEAASRYAGSLTVIAIGPLTNIAEAIDRDPSLPAHVRQLVVMGGEFMLGVPEYNVCCDVDAARSVLASSIPSLYVGLDVTTTVAFDVDDLNAVTCSGSPAARLISDQVHIWWDKIGMKSCHPHDPLAMLAMLEPDLFEFDRRGWQVSTEGRELGALVPSDIMPPIEHAIAVDASAARLSLRRRLARAIGCASGGL